MIVWAVQPNVSVRASSWNLTYGTQFDITHPVNLRRLLRDSADGDILGCMMSVPSMGWNAARDNGHPLRSHFQPWGIERSRAFLCPSDLACLDTGNRIMRAAIKLARQCHRFKIPWTSTHPHNSCCWSTPQLTQLANMRNVHEITFDFCAFGIKWRKRTTVLAGHVDSADVYSLNKMRCHGRTRCTFTDEKHMQLVVYDYSYQCSRANRAKTYRTKLAAGLAYLVLGPTLTARMQRTRYDLGMQRDR